MRRRLALMALPAMLGLLGCGKDGLEGQDPTLHAFQTCGELEAHLEAVATRRMNAQIDSYLADDTGQVSPEVFDSRLAATPAPGGASDYTTTNTQERGVDEPDYIKNDGSRIFVLQGQSLVGVDAWPPESLAVQSVTPIEGDASSMFYDGRTVVVFSTVYRQRPDGPLSVRLSYPSYRDYSRTKVSVFDVSGAVPRLGYELFLDERYVTARKVGRVLRVVTASRELGPELRYWPEEDFDWRNASARRAAYERLRAANLKLIRSATLEDWLPAIDERRSGQSLATLTRECSAVHTASVDTAFGISTVTTLDLNRLGQGNTYTSVLSPVDEAYASRESLYLTARSYWNPFALRAPSSFDNRTYLHKFDLQQTRPRYVASGSVPGQIIDQFSLDERDGYLRVATHRGNSDWGFTVGSNGSNGVSVLHAEQGRLVTVGEVAGLAPGEQLYSARFEGNRGYVVTFRQIDPLFTLDLRVPTAPRVAGELKVPGFSTYLHPVDAQHLLAIGREVGEDGRTMGGVQLQIFDVSNLAQPALQHKLELGSRHSSSEAGYDPKAFNFFANRGLLGIPFSDWTPAFRGGSYRSTIELFRVSTQTGIESIGSVDHSDIASEPGQAGWSPYIRRSVMMEDYVYSISWGGVKVNDVRALSQTIAAVPLPAPW